MKPAPIGSADTVVGEFVYTTWLYDSGTLFNPDDGSFLCPVCEAHNFLTHGESVMCPGCGIDLELKCGSPHVEAGQWSTKEEHSVDEIVELMAGQVADSIDDAILLAAQTSQAQQEDEPITMKHLKQAQNALHDALLHSAPQSTVEHLKCMVDEAQATHKKTTLHMEKGTLVLPEHDGPAYELLAKLEGTSDPGDKLK